MQYVWNTWHGCQKYSEGCLNCYVYRRDGSVGRDASEVKKNSTFDLAVKRNRNGEYKIPPMSEVFVCMTSDFFLDKADMWRGEVWDMIKYRSDVSFYIITKRIVRFAECIPDDWGDGYDNVTIICTVESQKQCDIRLPVFVGAPIKRKLIACEPLLTPIDLSPYLKSGIKGVVVGGESGNEARVCKYDWVLDIRSQCVEAGVKFTFRQTGANFVKDGRSFRILRKYQHSQARKAMINT